ncbi:DUF6414 family protein [Sinosporangium siamense]|nr:hypothetical protein [Sinosporangium siamense]
MDYENKLHFLAHPVYLDVPMMMSFLAQIQGGVAMEEEETRKEGKVGEKNLKGTGKAKLPSLSGIFGVEVGVEGGGAWKREGLVESKAAKQHTEVSLFNALYAYLHGAQKIVSLQDAGQLGQLGSGDLIELSGSYAGNPLEENLSFFMQITPYLDMEDEGSGNKKENAPSRSKRRRSVPARTQSPEVEVQRQVEAAASAQMDYGWRIARRLYEDISSAPVHDVLIRMDETLKAILTVSSEFHTSATSEYLRSGEFKVLGKVTQVLTDDQNVNLARRTVLGVAGGDMVNEMVDNLRSSAGLHFDVADPIGAPAIQILPMAIFV